MAKRGKGKKVSYELLECESDIGRPLYALLDELVTKYHEDLRDARIALAWCTSWKPDVDGRVTLGKCVKASDLHRELAPYDFVILLSRSFMESLRVTALQRRALIDHELCHAAVSYDTKGEPVVDERGRRVYRVRKHDLEEFSMIAERYGCWKRDLEHFAQALERADARVPGYWIGTQRLRDLLHTVGLTVPLEVLSQWSQTERLEAEEWALLRKELGQSGRSAATAIAQPGHITTLLAGEPLLFEESVKEHAQPH